jgi:hypothetical protein
MSILQTVGVLVRGSLSVPDSFAGVFGFAARCPYVTFDFSAAEVSGGGERKSRIGLARKRHGSQAGGAP